MKRRKELWSTVDIVALSLLPKLTSAQMFALLNGFATFQDAVDSMGMLLQTALADAERTLERAAKHNVHVVTIQQPLYPRRLLQLESAPLVLYVRGALPKPLAPSIAVVGTRTCSTMYGKPATEMCVQEWTQRGCVIVSGLANGIDTIAHQACVHSGGVTVAVIASGIDRITPAHAQRCVQQIVDAGGCVVSEYACGIAALPPYFPARNRIISALSDAVVVIESKHKGGALITAQFANRLGIPVFALPGNITSTRSVGTNALIANGNAYLLESAQHIFEHEASPSKLRECKDQNNQQTMLINTDSLLPLQLQILEILGGNEMSVDTLANHVQSSVHALRAVLLGMEFSGYIQHHPGGRFSARAKPL